MIVMPTGVVVSYHVAQAHFLFHLSRGLSFIYEIGCMAGIFHDFDCPCSRQMPKAETNQNNAYWIVEYSYVEILVRNVFSVVHT